MKLNMIKYVSGKQAYRLWHTVFFICNFLQILEVLIHNYTTDKPKLLTWYELKLNKENATPQIEVTLDHVTWEDISLFLFWERTTAQGSKTFVYIIHTHALYHIFI